MQRGNFLPTFATRSVTTAKHSVIPAMIAGVCHSGMLVNCWLSTRRDHDVTRVDLSAPGTVNWNGCRLARGMVAGSVEVMPT